MFFTQIYKFIIATSLIIIALSKAYIANQQKSKAINLLELNKDKVDPDVREEIEKVLKKIKTMP